VKTNNLFHRLFWTSLILVLALAPTLPAAEDKEVKTMAILPFTMNAADDLTHIQNGIGNMLYSRLSWRDHVLVIPGKQIQAVLSKMGPITGNQLVSQIAKETSSDYVLTGSVTELAGSFSIDAQVYDIKNKRFMDFYEQSKENDELIDKVDRIAATINHEAFNRSTVTHERMEREKQAHLNKLKRQNPEHLMNVPNQKDEGPGWKVWEYLF
jgi:TolB-like protein